MRLLAASTFSAVLLLAGCHSRYIAATVTNRTGAPLSPVELDYPSASFGVNSLASGATYSYRFKIIGNGPTAILWTDSAHRDHKVTGPALHEGDEGTLAVTIAPDAPPAWDLRLIHRGGP
jgi:hypothetical protein